MFVDTFLHPSPTRIRQFRQPHERSGGHPGHERIPDRDEEAEGAAEEAQGCQPTLLRSISRDKSEKSLKEKKVMFLMIVL